MRVVVVGGGILGAATARLVARARADAQVVLLEREADLATHQTARTSGVVHAGIYLTNALLPAGSVRSSTRCANLPTSFASGRAQPESDELHGIARDALRAEYSRRT